VLEDQIRLGERDIGVTRQVHDHEVAQILGTCRRDVQIEVDCLLFHRKAGPGDARKVRFVSVSATSGLPDGFTTTKSRRFSVLVAAMCT
jgi:hypothetical protein